MRSQDQNISEDERRKAEATMDSFFETKKELREIIKDAYYGEEGYIGDRKVPMLLDGTSGDREHDFDPKSDFQQAVEAVEDKDKMMGRERISQETLERYKKELVMIGYLSNNFGLHFVGDSEDILRQYPKEFVQIAQLSSLTLSLFSRRGRKTQVAEYLEAHPSAFLAVMKNMKGSPITIFNFWEFLMSPYGEVGQADFFINNPQKVVEISRKFGRDAAGGMAYYFKTEEITPEEASSLKIIFDRAGLDAAFIGRHLGSIRPIFRSNLRAFERAAEVSDWTFSGFVDNISTLPPERILRILSLFSNDKEFAKVKGVFERNTKMRSPISNFISYFGVPTPEQEEAVRSIHTNTEIPERKSDGGYSFEALLDKFRDEFRRDPEFFVQLSRFTTYKFHALLGQIDFELTEENKKFLLVIAERYKEKTEGVLDKISDFEALFEFQDFIFSALSKLSGEDTGEYFSITFLRLCNDLPQKDRAEMDSLLYAAEDSPRKLWEKVYKLSQGDSLNSGYFAIQIRKFENFRYCTPETQQVLLGESVSGLQTQTDVDQLSHFSDFLQKALAGKDIALEVKTKILDVFQEYFLHPENFEFTKVCDSVFCTQMSNAFSYGLLKNLAREEFSDIRGEKVDILLSFSEKVLASSAPERIDFVRARFVAVMSRNVFQDTELSGSLRARIDALNVIPTRPEKSIFKDGKFVSKIYFQERIKEELWKKMYINPGRGFQVEGYSLAMKDTGTPITVAGIRESAQAERAKVPYRFRTERRLIDTLLQQGSVVYRDVRVSVDDCVRIANAVRNEERNIFENSQNRAIGYVLRQIGIFDNEIWSRSWQAHGETRVQKIIIPRSPYEWSHFDRKVFENLSKNPTGDKVDYLLYNGHAGGGTGLDASFSVAEDMYEAPVIQLSNCWSQTELHKIQKYFPNSHPIVTKVTAVSSDGALIFGTMMEEVKENWDNTRYENVRHSIDTNTYNIVNRIPYSRESEAYLEGFGQPETWEVQDGTDGKKYIVVTGELQPKNRIFVDEMEELRDSDGDRIPDIEDDTYDFVPEKVWRNSYEFQFTRPNLSEMTAAPAEKVNQTIGFIARLFEDDPFLSHFSFRDDKIGNGFPKFIIDHRPFDNYEVVNAGGFFISKTDSQDVLTFNEGTDSLETSDGQTVEEPVIRISLNLGYANVHLEALRARIFSEVLQYAHEKYFDLSRGIFESDILQDNEKYNGEVVQRLGLEKTHPDEIFQTFGVEGDERITLANRARALIYSLRYWQRTYVSNEQEIQEQGEMPERLQARDGFENIFRRTLQEHNFSVDMTTQEMADILSISANPHLWFLRFVISKNRQ